MKKMCFVFLIILSVSFCVFNNEKKDDDFFSRADNIKVVRVASNNSEGVYCGNYIIENNRNISGSLVGIILTYYNVDIDNIIDEFGIRIIRSYFVDGYKVIDGITNYDVLGKFERVQIAVSDNIIVGFPTIINGF